MKSLKKKQKIYPLRKYLQFDFLLNYFRKCAENLPDPVKRKNRTYSIVDMALSAFSVFFTQSPSFLAYQTLMEQKKGNNNVRSLFTVNKIPSDTRIRNVMDKIPYQNFFPVFYNVLDALKKNSILEEFHFLGGHLLIALDGTGFFSSEKIHCDKCSTKTHKDGHVTYYHSALTPVIVKPKKEHVISLPPEFIEPQDGNSKQDCEIAASKRWLDQHADKFSDEKVIILGDDLYSHQPFIQEVQKRGFHYLLTCKKASHRTIYHILSLIESAGGFRELTVRKGEKEFRYSFVNGVNLKAGDSISTNWCRLQIVNNDKEVTYTTACITDINIAYENVEEIIAAKRSRWKIENENNNTLKTKGYNLEHNFGHGKNHLTSTLIILNLLAFLFHTILDLTDDSYKLLRQSLGARKRFFELVRSVTMIQIFENWEGFVHDMLVGMEIEPP